MKQGCFDISGIEWQPLRPEMTTGVFAKVLLDEKVKVVIVRVEPGGGFREHSDDYAHMFHFLEGSGRVSAGEQTYDALAGITVHISAGELHSYTNTGEADMLLISVNIPKSQIADRK